MWYRLTRSKDVFAREWWKYTDSWHVYKFLPISGGIKSFIIKTLEKVYIHVHLVQVKILGFSIPYCTTNL